MRNQTFGVEVEMNSITRACAAQVLADHFGTRVRHTGGPYDTRLVTDMQGRDWKVVSDASIEGPQEQRTELVSPICTWEDIETVQALVRKLRQAGAKAHSSTGIHVHIGRGQHTPKTLRNLVNLVNAKENLLALALGISQTRLDRWCQPIDPAFLARLNRRKPSSDAAFAQLWYNTPSWEAHARQHYDPTRYHLLNLHSVFQKGTIEFRAFNGTLHAGEIKAYIQLAMAISYQALTVSSASPRKSETDNPKYTFRCWLLRLGFIGDEFAAAREHLTKRLPGNAAWRQAS